jgi:aspartate-semialdehyde dehydrogenase
MTDSYRVAVVGATGVVGQTVLRILEERRFPVAELVPFASERSVGKPVIFREQELFCQVLAEDAIEGFDLVFSSAGGGISKAWMPKFAAQGSIVIDKSSAFRATQGVPLVVPEVNPDAIQEAIVGPKPQRIIASPNCSTTQLVVALDPLRKAAGIERLVISTYQAVSGTGSRAREELKEQSRAVLSGREIARHDVYPHRIAFNALPQAGAFLDDDSGRTDEEQKLTDETRRIFADQSIGISATCVRVPVDNCHSEAVNVEFGRSLSPEEARQLLRQAPGVIVIDDPDRSEYPMAIQADGKDEVFVGRIRRDPSHDRALDLWIVADNLRKGAATNAVQIAELLHEQRFLSAARANRATPEPVHA